MESAANDDQVVIGCPIHQTVHVVYGAIIVTWNIADTKKAAGMGVKVLTPRDFLKLLEN